MSQRAAPCKMTTRSSGRLRAWGSRQPSRAAARVHARRSRQTRAPERHIPLRGAEALREDNRGDHLAAPRESGQLHEDRRASLLASMHLFKKPLAWTRAGRTSDAHLRSEPQMLQYQAIARRIAAEQAGPVLDWGTGFGQVAKMLADEGVDVTPFEYRTDVPAGVRPLERYPERSAHLSYRPSPRTRRVRRCAQLRCARAPPGP